MKFTVDTYNRTVTIQSSVPYEEFKELREKFPAEFLDNYTWFIPVESIDAAWQEWIKKEEAQKQLDQRPYPVQRYEEQVDACACGSCGC